MKCLECPHCNTSINLFSSTWREQKVIERSRKCPHCNSKVTNTFSGLKSLAILFLTFALAVGFHGIAPWLPMGLWGIIGAIALFVFASQFKAVE